MMFVFVYSIAVKFMELFPNKLMIWIRCVKEDIQNVQSFGSPWLELRTAALL